MPNMRLWPSRLTRDKVGGQPLRRTEVMMSRHLKGSGVNRLRTWLSVGLFLGMATLSAGAEGERIDSCGRISRMGDCLVFQAYSGSPRRDYVLPDTTYVKVGSEWRIVGDARLQTRVCWTWSYRYALEVISISPCVPETLGCGVLWDFNPDYDCYVWSELGNAANTILVGPDLHGYALGDTVRAIGVRDPCLDVCICGCGCLSQSRFTSCGDTVTSVMKLSWGRVKALYGE